MLIDSERLKTYFSWWSDEPNKELFCEIIDRQPEAVVRCKHCIYADKPVCKNGEPWVYSCSENGCCAVKPDDYCSRGDRGYCVDCKHSRTIEQNEWLDTKCVLNPENKRSVSLTDFCDKWEAR